MNSNFLETYLIPVYRRNNNNDNNNNYNYNSTHDNRLLCFATTLKL